MRKISLLLITTVLYLLPAFAQRPGGTITGKIITVEGNPAEGVTILVKNSIKSAVADNSGTFKIRNVDPGEYELVVSLVGYNDETKQVTVRSGETATLNIRLSLTDRELNEVVVVANKNSFKTNRVSNSLRLQSSILETPQNIQVITSKLISNQQIFDMLEGVTRNVSGAARIEHWDNYAQITMRGSRVGAFRNGMNVSADWGPLTEDMSMVERIEFVKGPAGFIIWWGRKKKRKTFVAGRERHPVKVATL